MIEGEVHVHEAFLIGPKRTVEAVLWNVFCWTAYGLVSVTGNDRASAQELFEVALERRQQSVKGTPA